MLLLQCLAEGLSYQSRPALARRQRLCKLVNNIGLDQVIADCLFQAYSQLFKVKFVNLKFCCSGDRFLLKG